MKIYKYKIQWIFDVSINSNLIEALDVIKILGHRSFDTINYLDENFKSINSFSNIMFDSSQEDDVRDNITKEIITFKAKYIELLRG